MYRNMGDCPKALSSYEKALAIQQHSHPPAHPRLVSTYDRIGLAHETMGDYSKAHSHFERAVDIAQCSLPENYPDLQKHRNNLARIKIKL